MILGPSASQMRRYSSTAASNLGSLFADANVTLTRFSATSPATEHPARTSAATSSFGVTQPPGVIVSGPTLYAVFFAPLPCSFLNSGEIVFSRRLILLIGFLANVLLKNGGLLRQIWGSSNMTHHLVKSIGRVPLLTSDFVLEH